MPLPRVGLFLMISMISMVLPKTHQQSGLRAHRATPAPTESGPPCAHRVGYGNIPHQWQLRDSLRNFSTTRIYIHLYIYVLILIGPERRREARPHSRPLSMFSCPSNTETVWWTHLSDSLRSSDTGLFYESTKQTQDCFRVAPNKHLTVLETHLLDSLRSSQKGCSRSENHATRPNSHRL